MVLGFEWFWVLPTLTKCFKTVDTWNRLLCEFFFLKDIMVSKGFGPAVQAYQIVSIYLPIPECQSDCKQHIKKYYVPTRFSNRFRYKNPIVKWLGMLLMYLLVDCNQVSLQKWMTLAPEAYDSTSHRGLNWETSTSNSKAMCWGICWAEARPPLLGRPYRRGWCDGVLLVAMSP